QPGFQNARSRWITGNPVLPASATANVLLPDPARPVTTILRPIANEESLTLASVPHPATDHTTSIAIASRRSAELPMGTRCDHPCKPPFCIDRRACVESDDRAICAPWRIPL
ncbi:MAG: hypothetical protein JWL72_4004, partial [Ilumatobacteraceae bacterium]|nr:hypothetical protein [Ilumatobacteraceae bacterium]